jgi:hypothetical protein
MPKSNTFFRIKIIFFEKLGFGINIKQQKTHITPKKMGGVYQ